MAHLRRWKRRGHSYAIEWNGRPVKDVDKAFRAVAHEAGLPEVTTHVLRHTAPTWLIPFLKRQPEINSSAAFLMMRDRTSLMYGICERNQRIPNRLLHRVLCRSIEGHVGATQRHTINPMEWLVTDLSWRIEQRPWL
jgi:hypothetical protein